MTKTVLITGCNGRIGKPFVAHLDSLDTSYQLRLVDLDKQDERGIVADVTNMEQCQTICKNVDMIIHLAADPSTRATFDELLGPNIIGVHNIFEAAAQNKVRRVIFASSIHAVAGYPTGVQVKTDMPVRPLNLYGVSKAYGEAIASYYAYQRDMEAIAIRIGAYEFPDGWKPSNMRQLNVWTEPQDMFVLLIRCLEADLDEPFMIAHGLSDNRFKRMDISDTKRKLNYDPRSDAFETYGVKFESNSKRSQDN